MTKKKQKKGFGRLTVSTIAVMDPQGVGIDLPSGVEPIVRLPETPIPDGQINFGDFLIEGSELRNLIDTAIAVGAKVGGIYTNRSASTSSKSKRLEIRLVNSDPRASSYEGKMLPESELARILEQISSTGWFQVKLVTILMGRRPDEFCAHILIGKRRQHSAGEWRKPESPSLKLWQKNGAVYVTSE